MAFKSTGNAYCVVPTCLHSWPLYFLCFEFSEYLDESMLIPKNTSVLIHQVPGRPRVRLITAQEPRIENKVEHVQAETRNSHVALPPAAKYYKLITIEYEFGNDFYFIPAASIDTPALDWQRHLSTLLFLLDLIGNVKIILGQGEVTYRVRIKTPPPGYICHRCNVAGHCIHHFPTNGNSNYNVKRVKPPTGIPKSILVALIHCQVVQLQLLNQKRKLCLVSM
ncbi:unnamed protein product [Brassica rapa]|uniref:Uncharacterized protein n=1 Tax=Brassica campestris TaxID=3711 RepID=A0A8D9DHD3_BRACM|nr:unnamed protein product [Brassica rapa]